MRLTATAHEVLAAATGPGDIAVDATAGNGHDTVFLARQVGNTGHVYSFDIQSQALAATASRLAAAGTGAGQRVTLINACHSRMSEEIPIHLQGKIACVMFNLGYLPGGAHSVTTTATTSVQAIGQALDMLRPGGVLSVLGYTGHSGGQAEVDAIEQQISGSAAAIADWQEFPAAQSRPAKRAAAMPRLFIAHRRG
ncbi:MAG: rRNA methyltransferase [Gammaproteobacteria bacterium]|nr:rRNA methyltransferase [Gammaproteobacteria bacterium]